MYQSSSSFHGVVFGCFLLGALSLPTLAGAAEQANTSKPGSKTKIDFENGEVGKAPMDFSTGLTGKGKPGRWVIQEDAKAPSGKKVLAQAETDETDNHFPVCVNDKISAKDVDVSVRFKSVSGKVDQAGGLVARYKDQDNYYTTRANALEDNIRLYKVVKGDRLQFAGVNTKVTSGEWHQLGLKVEGKHFKVEFDGKVLFEADDDTFGDAGKVGLWTKADSVTLFDDLEVSVNK